MSAAEQVALHVAHGAHAGDDRADRVVGEDVAQGDLGEAVALDAEVLGDRLRAVEDLPPAVAAEVVGAEVALGELVSGVMRPVSEPSSNGTRTITPTSCSGRRASSSSSGLWSKTL